MDKFDYLTLSERTASGHYHGGLVSLQEMRNAFEAAIEAAQRIDRIKKLLFYGEDLAKGRVARSFDNVGDGKSAHTALDRLYSAPFASDDLSREDAEFVIHGVLGVVSEAGEMVEALYESIFKGEPLDLTNLGEESGDTKWYLAMIARVRKVLWDDDERINIAKLQHRFPDKFTTEAANERDLTGERQILEGRVQTQFTEMSDTDYVQHMMDADDVPPPLRPEQKAD